jgi:hypothetical protein
LDPSVPPPHLSTELGQVIHNLPERPDQVYMVGFDHALRLGQALRLRRPDLAVQTVHLNSWTPLAFSQAAGALRGVDLRRAVVILWLHDDAVFVQADLGGIPLERSAADGLRHCTGRLGTVDRIQMETLCQLTRPVLQVPLVRFFYTLPEIFWKCISTG